MAERVGLVMFGGLLILAGLVIFAMPAIKGAAKVAGTATVAGKALGITGGAARADIARRQQVAEQSMALGERKLALKERRENRLDRASQPKPAVTAKPVSKGRRHTKPGPASRVAT
jgi:hypothetical protein